VPRGGGGELPAERLEVRHARGIGRWSRDLYRGSRATVVRAS
jgi:hypothetical protein